MTKTLNENIAVLRKGLPNCPKGRIFKSTVDGQHFYHFMTDKEVISGRLKAYSFTKDEVRLNPAWFKMTTELKIVDSAVRCTKCGAGMGKCDCWTQCECGWLFEKGTKYRNPIHKNKSDEVKQ